MAYMAFESRLIAECAPDEVFFLLCTDPCTAFKKKVFQNDLHGENVL